MKSKMKNRILISLWLLMCWMTTLAQEQDIFRQQCMPYVELECDGLTDFLKKVVEPVYTKNKGDCNVDKLTLYIIEDSKNPSSCGILLELYRNRFGKFEQSYFKSEITLKNYATKIGSLKIAVYCTPNAPVLKPIKGKKLCFKVPVDNLSDELWDKYVQPLYMQGTNDNHIQWKWSWDNGNLEFKSVSQSCDWFSNLPKFYYTPL